jgi:phosphoglycolate phosphatase
MAMSEPVKPLLIFDFDGTIANTVDTGISIYNDIAPEFGLKPFTREDVIELRKLNMRAILDRFGVSKIKAIKVATRIRKEIHDRMDEVETFAGIEEAVKTLHGMGYRIGILSSNSTDNIRGFIKRFDLEPCFSFIEAGVSLFGKSSRLNQAIKKQNVEPGDAIYIGDETRDMEAARKSHVCAVAVCWGANDREAMITEGPAFCIEHPAELLEVVLNFEKGIRSSL